MKSLAFIVLALYPILTKDNPRGFNFVIWDVGQGSWTTFIQDRTCLHIDVGGEKPPWKQVLKHCEKKVNKVWITHTDWDHINRIKGLKRRVVQLCIMDQDLKFTSPRTRKYLGPIPKCKELIGKKKNPVRLLFAPSSPRNRNEASHIFTVKNKILLTGDSTKKMEKKWLPFLNPDIPYILLGHHGSRTSTSAVLLKKTSFQMAFVSARKAKYGHPHPKVIQSLQKARVPLISTEVWGNIYLRL